MPIEYAHYEYFVAATQLVLAMLGMGATLTFAEFHAILRRPHGIGYVFVFQYFFCPLLAIGLARWFGLSGAPATVGIALGLLIVAAMPSGALSNIFTYLGKGNVPLSITATCASTLGCLLLTPLVLRTFQPDGLPANFHMPTERILRDIIVCLLVPLSVGMAIGHRWRHGRKTFARWCIRGSLVFLTLLVVGSLTSGRIDVFDYGLKVPFVLILFGLVLLGPVQVLAHLLGFNGNDAFTMGIEITMRNCNVAILLKATIFPAKMGVADPIGDGVLFAAMFYGGASLFIGMLPIVRRNLVDRYRARCVARLNIDRPQDATRHDNQRTTASSVV